MVALPETRYVDVGGRGLAYQVFGDGPVDIVVAPGYISHLDLNWSMPSVVHFYRRLSSMGRVIVYDKAGTGLSDPPLSVPSVDDRAGDLLAVIDAAGARSPVVIGISEGGPAAIVLAAQHPDRVGKLVIYGSFARGEPSADHLPELTERVRQQWDLMQTADTWGTGASIAALSPTLAATSATMKLAAAYERAAASPAMAKMIIAAARGIDVRYALPAIDVPTLVVHRSGDVIPVENAHFLAEQIVGAKLVELPGIDHVPWLGDADTLLDAIEQFATGHRVNREPQRALRTILFTDIVSSTQTAAGMGDGNWRDVLDRHDEFVEEVLSSFEGRAVKALGDGHLAAFTGAAAAVRCAQELCERAPELGLQLRAGVHTGECELRGDDLGGIAVHIGARIGALAGAGEVLLSGTVRDLVVGSNLEFDDRGEHELKGVPGVWRLYSLHGEGEAPAVPDHVTDLRRVDRVNLALSRRAPSLARAAGRIVMRRAERKLAGQRSAGAGASSPI